MILTLQVHLDYKVGETSHVKMEFEKSFFLGKTKLPCLEHFVGGRV